MNMSRYIIDKGLEKEVQSFMQNVLGKLKRDGNDIDDSWSAALTMIADNYHLYVKCRKTIAEDGLTVTDRFGTLQKHPLLKVQTDSQIQLVKLLLEFGLTLKSGSKLNMEPIEEDSPLMAFVNKNKNKVEKR